MSGVFAYQLKFMSHYYLFNFSLLFLNMLSIPSFFFLLLLLFFSVLFVANVSLYPLPYQGARISLKCDPSFNKVPETKALTYNILMVVCITNLPFIYHYDFIFK